jgi:hypothetical protein
MSVAKGRLNWGVFFIMLGAVPLAYHQGVISSSALGDAWRLWPLVVVGIGVGFLLSRTPAYFVGGLVVAATLGLVFGSLFAVGPNIGCGGPGGHPTTVSQSGNLSGSATVRLDLQCGSADVSTSTDGQWHVRATNDAGNDATITSAQDALEVTSDGSGNHWFNQGRDDWQVALPAGQRLDLTASMDMGDATYKLAGARLDSASFEVNLGSMHLDLSGAQIANLTVSTNLGSAAVTLDGSSDVAGDLKTSLGSLKVCAPPELGVQIRSSDSLSSSNFSGLGMSLTGGVWETSNYQTAQHHATLTINTSLGSFEVQSAGGCK